MPLPVLFTSCIPARRCGVEHGRRGKTHIEQKGKVVEYKSASAGNKAMPGNILQVAAEMMATGANEAELR
jgi:hypothetical protein